MNLNIATLLAYKTESNEMKTNNLLRNRGDGESKKKKHKFRIYPFLKAKVNVAFSTFALIPRPMQTGKQMNTEYTNTYTNRYLIRYH